jgi:hypothetical protein
MFGLGQVAGQFLSGKISEESMMCCDQCADFYLDLLLMKLGE